MYIYLLMNEGAAAAAARRDKHKEKKHSKSLYIHKDINEDQQEINKQRYTHTTKPPLEDIL